MEVCHFWKCSEKFSCLTWLGYFCVFDVKLLNIKGCLVRLSFVMQVKRQHLRSWWSLDTNQWQLWFIISVTGYPLLLCKIVFVEWIFPSYEVKMTASFSCLFVHVWILSPGQQEVSCPRLVSLTAELSPHRSSADVLRPPNQTEIGSGNTGSA